MRRYFEFAGRTGTLVVTLVATARSSRSRSERHIRLTKSRTGLDGFDAFSTTAEGS